jgi:hypothetical protein
LQTVTALFGRPVGGKLAGAAFAQARQCPRAVARAIRKARSRNGACAGSGQGTNARASAGVGTSGGQRRRPVGSATSPSCRQLPCTRADIRPVTR